MSRIIGYQDLYLVVRGNSFQVAISCHIVNLDPNRFSLRLQSQVEIEKVIWIRELNSRNLNSWESIAYIWYC